MRIRMTRLASGDSADVLPIKNTPGDCAVEIVGKPTIGYIDLKDELGRERVYLELEADFPGYGTLVAIIDVLREELDEVLKEKK